MPPQRAGRQPLSALALAALAAAPAQAAEADFLAGCRSEVLKREPAAARWVDSHCRQRWQHVVAGGPAADLLLAVLPATPAERPTLAALRQRAAGVRWSARPRAPALAAGKLGELDIAIEGRGRPATLAVGWSRVGADVIPYDVAGALRVRGATLTLASCEKTGVGAGTRVFAGSVPGRAPFTLTIDQQTAPLGHMQSYYVASASLDGRHPPRGAASDCDF